MGTNAALHTVQFEGEDLVLVHTGPGPAREFRLPLGYRRIAARFFPSPIPSEAQVEDAINFIEDELMRDPEFRNHGAPLAADDEVLASVLGSSEPREFSLADVEERFTKFALVSLGRSVVHDGLTVTAEGYAALLVLREVMHHLGYTTFRDQARHRK